MLRNLARNSIFSILYLFDLQMFIKQVASRLFFAYYKKLYKLAAYLKNAETDLANGFAILTLLR